MKYEHINEIKGIIISALSLLLLASLVSFSSHDLPWYTSSPNPHVHNWIGIAGAYVAGGLFFVLGYSAYFCVVIGLFWSWNKFTSREIVFSFPKFLSLIVLFIVTSALLSFTGGADAVTRFGRCGVVGIAASDFLMQYFSPLGSLLILFTFLALSLVVIGEFMVSPFFVWLAQTILAGLKKCAGSLWRWPLPIKQEAKNQTKPAVATVPVKAQTPLNNTPKANVPDNKTNDKPQPTVVSQPKPPVAAVKVADKNETPNIHIIKTDNAPKATVAPKVVGQYHLPTLDLLNDPPVISTDQIQEVLMRGAKVLEETLTDFGVNVKVADIERGPVITRYELQPAPGVKVGSILSLSDDLALALSVPAVRIVAPIPGKNRVGVEVPNGSSAAVYLKDVLAQGQFRAANSKLMLAVGKDISGKPLIADLASMPHLLIAGTTGSGKSVCLNSLIMSIIFNASPNEVKFIMVDPKMVEMVLYNDLPHLICPVVTDAKKATAALNWVVGEMESRYRILSKEQVRNIQGYHAKGHQMPYIVVVVDELADLMQVSAKSVEAAIARLAQLARAVGIHLILATQRPSVDVITGVIKANFSARISFKVASKVDSRTVLDLNGAQDLLGKGDLLFMKPGDAKPTRGQCCFVSDEEMGRVIDFIKKQAIPQYDETVLKPQAQTNTGGSEDKDDMYDEAVRVVIETNQASVTILQRRLRLGYSRAARLIDMMEQNGIVGAYAGSKARDILVDREKWLLENMGPKADSTNEQPTV